MTLVEKELTYFFSSSSALGAINKDNNGARFQVKLDRPIEVPPNAVDVKMEITAANIWFTTPNIEDIYQNNKLYLQYDNGEGLNAIIALEIPKGLYSVASLNSTIENLLCNTNIPASTEKFDCDAFVLTGNTATQKINLQLGENLSVFTDPSLENNIMATLGWYDPNDPNADLGLVGPSIARSEVFIAPSVATLNKINAYLIHGDIVKNGIQVNSSQANILTEIQLNVAPGRLLNYRPYIPYKLDGSHLKYGTRDLLTFWLTDEENKYVDTNGENFSFAMTVLYKVRVDHIMTNGTVPSAYAY